MCSHYISEKARERIEKRFGITLPPNWEIPRGGLHVYPTQWAPILRRTEHADAGDDAVPPYEMVEARFGLLPGFAKDVRFGTRTYNARSETIAELPSFRSAWSRAQHCIVPAAAFYEPDWRSGRCVPTKFALASGAPMGIAGVWNEWRSPGGEVVPSFAMITLNADGHALFRDMHRPDPERAPGDQDKRMVVILPASRYREWLDASVEDSMEFVRQYPAERLVATPEPGGSPDDRDDDQAPSSPEQASLF